MKVIVDQVIRHNTGKAFIVKKRQHIRVHGESTCDFVVFNLNNLKERFDQARTKVNQGKIFISTGDKLISKSNNVMMTIVEDKYKEGTHDLQKGMCSARVYSPEGPFYKGDVYNVSVLFGVNPKKLPDHGCWENLTEALKPWNIPAEDIPSPLNIFQTMKIDGKTGKMELTNIFPKPGTYIDFRAEMDCLVGASACPHLGIGKDLRIEVYEE